MTRVDSVVVVVAVEVYSNTCDSVVWCVVKWAVHIDIIADVAYCGVML